jgi:DNA-binding transcriptional regulator GbsR (MarR family)
MSQSASIDSPTFLELAEKVGSFIEYWGFKQVHGKIWTLIFLSPQPVDANFLKDSLKISKALTSMSLKDLLYYNVIEEVAKDKPGTQKYRMNPDITQVILDIINKRELKMLEEIQGSCKKAMDKTKQGTRVAICPKRLEELVDMVNGAHVLLKGMTAGQQVDFQIFADVTTIKD